MLPDVVARASLRLWLRFCGPAFIGPGLGLAALLRLYLRACWGRPAQLHRLAWHALPRIQPGGVFGGSAVVAGVAVDSGRLLLSWACWSRWVLVSRCCWSESSPVSVAGDRLGVAVVVTWSELLAGRGVARGVVWCGVAVVVVWCP